MMMHTSCIYPGQLWKGQVNRVRKKRNAWTEHTYIGRTWRWKIFAGLFSLLVCVRWGIGKYPHIRHYFSYQRLGKTGAHCSDLNLKSVARALNLSSFNSGLFEWAIKGRTTTGWLIREGQRPDAVGVVEFSQFGGVLIHESLVS